jgi:hypothetical protein
MGWSMKMAQAQVLNNECIGIQSGLHQQSLLDPKEDRHHRPAQ